ncbi:hypothetical protein SDC9_127772 [bioreactor metagenome]|uniref:Uncharacterized protein n=1 Tax=bioreactor metagenome TaxID=1076179 RepID=A0A645CVK2_9ZZZZ
MLNWLTTFAAFSSGQRTKNICPIFSSSVIVSRISCALSTMTSFPPSLLFSWSAAEAAQPIFPKANTITNAILINFFI